MIYFNYNNELSSAASLANTLHEMGVISDEMFDRLLDEIYEKYGGYYVADAYFGDEPI